MHLSGRSVRGLYTYDGIARDRAAAGGYDIVVPDRLLVRDCSVFLLSLFIAVVF